MGWIGKRTDDKEGRLLLAEYEARKKARPWRFYRSVPAILPFHKSESAIRLLAGPNRGGKTTAGAYELVCFATGYNPYRKEKYQTPNLTWAISLDYGSLGHVMRQKVFSILPPGYRFYKQESIVVLPKPWQSEIHFKSADSGREKFQGAGLLAAWFDEEPKGSPGEDIFSEVYARRAPGVRQRIFLTFTPLQGLSWSYRKLWDPDSEDRLPGVETFAFSIFDCSKAHGGFLDDATITAITSGYSEAEYDARVYGKYGILAGRSYFRTDLIDKALKGCSSGSRYRIRYGGLGHPVVERDDGGPLTVFRPPAPQHHYIMGVDAAGGVGRDASVASVWDRDDLALCAEWYSNKVDADEFGNNAVLPLAQYYGNALVVVESNGEHGGTVIAQLKGRYHNLYRHRQWNRIQSKYTDEYGWRTTAVSRMRVWDALAKCLREGTWSPNDRLLKEMLTVVTKDDGKVEHADGCNDDAAFASGIALAIHMDIPRYKYPRYEPTTYTGASGNEWMAT